MSWIEKDDPRKGFAWDKRLEMFGKLFFFEIETGSQFYKRETKIRKKIENYLKLEGRFHVVFVVADSKSVSASKYGEALLELFEETSRGTQFLVSPYDGLVNDPLGNWLAHHSGTTYSLSTIP